MFMCFTDASGGSKRVPTYFSVNVPELHENEGNWVEEFNLPTTCISQIGIVGRTGAGKSSMTLALFRLIEAAGGAIFVDDHNIGQMGLHDIRSKITIIPQVKNFFSSMKFLNIFSCYLDASDRSVAS